MTITTLPPELLTRICGYLELHEWGFLRITSQQIYNKTLEEFARRYYKSLLLLVTTESLNRLQEIAARDNLRTFVREVWIVPALFEGWHPMNYPQFASSQYGKMSRMYGGKKKDWDITEAELEARFAAYQAMVADHGSILESSTLSDTLASCLPLFENVVILGLRSYPIHLLLNSANDANFRCLGLHELRNQLSWHGIHRAWFNGPLPAVLAKTHTTTFLALVNALIKSDRKIQSLHTCGHYFCGLALEDIQLTESDYQALLPLLEELSSLHICIRFPEKTPPDETNFDSLINVLVTVAPKLEDLTFSQWIPKHELSPIYFENISQNVQFSHLRELHLQSIEITVDTFKAFLRTAASTLTKLTLKSVSLVDRLVSAPDPGPMTEESQGRSFSRETKHEIKQLWRRIFEHVGNHLRLKFILLHNLGYRGRHMTFYDRLYPQCGQLESPFKLRHVTACYDVEKSTVCLNTWITQLLMAMSEPSFFDLPGTNLGTSDRSIPRQSLACACIPKEGNFGMKEK